MAVSRCDKLEKINKAKKKIDGNFELSWASSHPNNIEFTSIEANKGRALLRYQKLTDIKFDEIFPLETAAMTLNSSKWPQPLLPWKMLLLRLNKK